MGFDDVLFRLLLGAFLSGIGVWMLVGGVKLLWSAF